MHEFDAFERRRTDRRPLDTEATASFAPHLTVINVGPRGLEIETFERLMVGQDYKVGIRSRGQSVPIHGAVVWSRLHRTMHTAAGELRPVYRAGIEAASASIPALEALIEGLPIIEA